MKIFLSFALSLIFHFGLFLYLQEKTPQSTFPQIKEEEKIKTNIRFVKLELLEKVKKEKDLHRNEVQKEVQLIEIPKKLESFKEFHPNNKKISDEIIATKKLPIEEEKQPQLQPKKEEMEKEVIPPQKQSPKTDPITNSYLELYKNDFESFPEETKIFLVKNIKDIGKITERYLIYPHISIRAKQQGINIVEFILHPNGKISVPKILKSSKYYILDDNSIETIERAYKDYPRPDKPTIIRIYVKYELI